MAQSTYSLDFDGSSGYVAFNAASAPFSAYTVSLWVKLNTLANCSVICLTNSNGASSSWSHQIRLRNASGTYEFEHYLYHGTTLAVRGNTTPATGVWCHLAITAENGGSAKLWVNGVDVSTTYYIDGVESSPPTISTLWTGGDRWRLAEASGASMGYLDGLVDDVAIFNSVLSGGTIAGIAEGSVDVATLSPVGLWRLEEGTGTSTLDTSGNSNTGTLNGGVSWSSDVARILGPKGSDTNTGGLYDNLEAYWKLDESSGDALDSHNLNDLPAYNSPGTTTGVINTARSFSYGSGQKFSGSAPSISTSGDLTISVWINIPSDASTNYYGIIRKGYPGASGGEWGINITPSKQVIFSMRKGDDSGQVSIASWPPITFGNTYHIVARYNSSTNAMNLTINNGESGETGSLTQARYVGTGPLTIGDNEFGNVSYGFIDEVGIWHDYLDDTAVTALNNSDSGLSYDDFGDVGSTDYTGSGSITTGEVICSGSGTYIGVYTGSGSIIHSETLCISDGDYTSPTYTGSGSITTSESTSSGTGTYVSPVYTGSGSLTHSEATCSSTGIYGTVVYLGSGSITFDQATCSGSGNYVTPVYSGSGSITFDQSTCSGSGSYTAIVFTGVGSITFSQVTVTGSGLYTTPVYTGSGSITLQRVTISGIGDYQAIDTGSDQITGGLCILPEVSGIFLSSSLISGNLIINTGVDTGQIQRGWNMPIQQPIFINEDNAVIFNNATLQSTNEYLDTGSVLATLKDLEGNTISSAVLDYTGDNGKWQGILPQSELANLEEFETYHLFLEISGGGGNGYRREEVVAQYHGSDNTCQSC